MKAMQNGAGKEGGLVRSGGDTKRAPGSNTDLAKMTPAERKKEIARRREVAQREKVRWNMTCHACRYDMVGSPTPRDKRLPPLYDNVAKQYVDCSTKYLLEVFKIFNRYVNR